MQHANNVAKEPPSGNSRRQQIMNPAFHRKFTITAAFLVFLASTIMSFGLYGVLHSQARARMIDPAAYQAQVGLVILMSALAFSAVTSSAICLWGAVATRRICDRLNAVGRDLTELAEGTIPSPRMLQRRDEMTEFYGTHMRAMAAVKARQQSEVLALGDALLIAKSAVDADEVTRDEAIASLVERLDALHLAVSQGRGVDSVVASGSIGETRRVPTESEREVSANRSVSVA